MTAMVVSNSDCRACQ